MHRKKVLHITLEMNESKTMMRYHQACFAITKRNQEVEVSTFERDSLDRFGGLATDVMMDRPSLADSGIKKLIQGKLKKTFKGDFLKVKQFPTGSLSIVALEAYLEQLARLENWIPDVLIVDYADLMKIDTGNLRTDTGRIYKELRGLGVSRNLAVVTASQSNRAGEDSKLISLKHLAEDYSKAAISDNVVTYNQTEAEKSLGLARIFVAKGRNDASGQVILLAQAYAMGQFAVDSVQMDTMDNRYWDILANDHTDDEDPELLS